MSDESCRDDLSIVQCGAHEVCVHCKFFSMRSLLEEDFIVGECRRHSPRLEAGDWSVQGDDRLDRYSNWPKVHEDHWCGEFAWAETPYDSKRFGQNLRQKMRREYEEEFGEDAWPFFVPEVSR